MQRCEHVGFIPILPGEHAITDRVAGCNSVVQNVLETGRAVATVGHIEAMNEGDVLEVVVGLKERRPDLNTGRVVGGDFLVVSVDDCQTLGRIEGGLILCIATYTNDRGRTL